MLECMRAVEAEMHDVDRLERMLKQPPAADAPAADDKLIDAPARFLRPKDTWAIKKGKETMDPLIIDDDTLGLGLQRQSPSASPQFPSGGDADGDSGNLNELNGEVRR